MGKKNSKLLKKNLREKRKVRKVLNQDINKKEKAKIKQRKRWINIWK